MTRSELILSSKVSVLFFFFCIFLVLCQKISTDDEFSDLYHVIVCFRDKRNMLFNNFCVLIWMALLHSKFFNYCQHPYRILSFLSISSPTPNPVSHRGFISLSFFVLFISEFFLLLMNIVNFILLLLDPIRNWFTNLTLSSVETVYFCFGECHTLTQSVMIIFTSLYHVTFLYAPFFSLSN